MPGYRIVRIRKRKNLHGCTGACKLTGRMVPNIKLKIIWQVLLENTKQLEYRRGG